MSISPARRQAYEILLAVDRGGDLPHLLAESRHRLADTRDQALAAELAMGALRWRAELDHVIGHLARRRPDALDPEVLLILRIAAYQLLHLSRIPASAAVNDAVQMVRRARKSSAAGLVNAVLRAIDRERARLPLPRRPEGANAEDLTDVWLDYFSVTLSHPRWLAARWLSRYGPEATERWLRFNNEPAPLTLRANRLRVDREALATMLMERGVSTAPAGFAPDGLVVTSGNPLRSPELALSEANTNDEHAAPFDAGHLFVVQDEASQLVGSLLPVETASQVLDACASPGGKTTQIAAAMGGRGLVVASDVRTRRVALLRHTVKRAGASNVRIVQADIAAGVPFGSTFDAVLLDAPCSGLGTLRRDPDIKWRRAEADLQPLANAELLMLGHAAEAVRPGGFLVYATCSSEPEENEQVVERFLASRSDFRPVGANELRPIVNDAVVDHAGHLRTFPHVHKLEAFFAALLVRAG